MSVATGDDLSLAYTPGVAQPCLEIQKDAAKSYELNNVLAFPGIFRGAFDVRAADINDAMKIAAAHALAGLVEEGKLRAGYIIPAAFDPRVSGAVAPAVASAAPQFNAFLKAVLFTIPSRFFTVSYSRLSC